MRASPSVVVSLVLVPLLLLSSADFAAEVTKRPNVLFILADDLGYHDLGCFNSSFYETPHLDRLAARGIKLTCTYVAPVCSPTRSSLMTGKYPARTGITDYLHKIPPTGQIKNGAQTPPFVEGLSLDEVTLAKAFKQAGYATFFAGKWHLGPEKYWPEHAGFDINKGGTGAGSPFSYFSPYKNPRLPDGPEGEHLDDRLARETVSFIEAHKNQPFLAYLCLYSVHVPLQAKPELVAKYEEKAKRLHLPTTAASSESAGGPASAGLFSTEGASKLRLVQSHTTYAAMVESMDTAVGSVLDALDRLGLTDNTIVVFLSDNGGVATSEGHPTSNLPLRAGKGWLYEGGVRVPCIVSVPGVTKPASSNDTPVAAPDFYPTLLDLTHLPAQPQQTVDGFSFAPLLKGDPFTRPAPIYWHYPHFGNQGGHPASAIRDGDFKLIQNHLPKTLELYNLKSDPAESHDLAAAEPQIRDRLLKELQSWQGEIHAAFPTPAPGDPDTK
jgi:arylsulfatase A-like enzyme